MQFGQEEELVWHGTVGIADRYGSVAPIHSNSSFFINQISRMIAAGSLVVVIWEEREQAVGITVTVLKPYVKTVGAESLNTAASGNRLRKNSEKDVFAHEIVQRPGVTSVAIDQNSELLFGV